ncbi:hypothetical protein [Nocardioides pantholopis]|uniref:hypothetical protein n=1 Tax=Nocardioides pantholopis TaxID=2483798 RepID=UPI000F0794C3|nr:hypothetical protein [Nocardioides pantholopis]
MVLSWVIRLRPVPAPEAAYRSVAHVVVLVQMLFLIAVEGLFAWLGVLTLSVPGEERVGGVTLGVALTALAMTVAFLAGLVRPLRRGDPPPAVPVGDGLDLPVRRLPIATARVGFVACAAAGAFAIGWPPGPGDRVLGVVIVLLFAGALTLTWVVSPQIRFDPDGLTLPLWIPAHRHLPWAEIERIEALGNFHPHLGVVLVGSTRPITCSLHSHAWAPSAILAAARHFTEHPELRATLTDPAALEPFRTWS